MTEIAISRPRPIQIARPRDDPGVARPTPTVVQRLGRRRPVRRAPVPRRLAAIVRAKLEPVDGDGLGNAATRRGQHLEPAIAEWWSDEHGIALYEPDVMYARGPILATLDRRIVGNDTDAVEIKTTAKHVTRPERYWWWQVQAQMSRRRPRAGPPRRPRRQHEPGHLRRRRATTTPSTGSSRAPTT